MVIKFEWSEIWKNMWYVSLYTDLSSTYVKFQVAPFKNTMHVFTPKMLHPAVRVHLWC